MKCSRHHPLSAAFLATLALCFLLGVAHAQVSAITFSNDDLDTTCANDLDLGLDYCTYLLSNVVIDLSPGAGSIAYANGVLNNFVCARAGELPLTLTNPRDGVTVTNGTSFGFFLQAPCDCDTITWTFGNESLVVSNNNADAVLNTCGACGPATGNTVCETLSDSVCYKAGFCSAGVCTFENNCVPTEEGSTSECNMAGDACVDVPCVDNENECLTATFDDAEKTCTYTTTPGCTPGVAPTPTPTPAPTPGGDKFNDPGKGGNWGLAFQIGFPMILTLIIGVIGLGCVSRVFVGIH